MPTALITGASGGIGYELAKLFAQDKWSLVLTARNPAALEKNAAEMRKLGSPVVTCIPKDLIELEAPDDIFAELTRRKITVDAMVNNAGFGVRGEFAKTDLNAELDMIQLNVVALTHLTKLFLPQMIERKSGYILNVASTAAFQAGPLMAVYYASKAYVLSFSEAIHEELRGTGVKVSCLCPGPTATGFAEAAGIAELGLFKRTSVMGAASVARIGYDGMKRGKAIVIAGGRNRLLAFATRFGSRAMTRRIAMSMQAK